MRDGFLIDNSVWQRLRKHSVLAVAEELWASGRTVMCPPIAAEIGFSARTPDDHRALMSDLSVFPDCVVEPSSLDVLALQQQVFAAGLFRAVGAVDVLIAAFALANDATVFHYDRDFELIAGVRPDFRQTWIVPRGSVDG